MHPKLHEVLRPLTEEEIAKIVPLSQEEIETALEKGRQDAEAIYECRDCRMLPPMFYR